MTRRAARDRSGLSCCIRSLLVLAVCRLVRRRQRTTLTWTAETTRACSVRFAGVFGAALNDGVALSHGRLARLEQDARLPGNHGDDIDRVRRVHAGGIRGINCVAGARLGQDPRVAPLVVPFAVGSKGRDHVVVAGRRRRDDRGVTGAVRRHHRRRHLRRLPQVVPGVAVGDEAVSRRTVADERRPAVGIQSGDDQAGLESRDVLQP